MFCSLWKGPLIRHYLSFGPIHVTHCYINKTKSKSKINSDPPMTKYDTNGNLITSHAALKNLYLTTYQNRLRHREMKPEYLDIYFLKAELWRSRLENMRQV